MARTTKTAARSRRSKSEVEESFSEIQNQLALTRDSSDAKSVELERMNAESVKQAVADISVESVVENISSLQVAVSKALNGVSEQLLAEVERLANARAAVALERGELEQLHKIDIAATSLDHLVQDYGREKERFENEMRTERSAWHEERQTAEQESKSEEESLKQKRQRESDEFEYKKALERKRAQDKYDEEMRLAEKRNQEKQEALDKSWQTREQALASKEAELSRLQKEAAELPARLKKEVDLATADAVRIATSKSEQHMALFKKDSEAERRVAELQVKTLEDVVARQSAQVAQLQKQLDEAKDQVQRIALQAIEGASGARALTHVNQIAMEQAKTRSPQT